MHACFRRVFFLHRTKGSEKIFQKQILKGGIFPIHIFTWFKDALVSFRILHNHSWLLCYIIFLNSLVTKWCKLLSAIFHLSHFTTWQTKKANFIEIHGFSPQYQCVFPLNGPCPVLSFLECPERNLLMVSNSKMAFL